MTFQSRCHCFHLFFSIVFFMISIFLAFFPSFHCEIIFLVSIAKSLALWFVASVHTTLFVSIVGHYNLKMTILCLFTR